MVVVTTGIVIESRQLRCDYFYRYASVFIVFFDIVKQTEVFGISLITFRKVTEVLESPRQTCSVTCS